MLAQSEVPLIGSKGTLFPRVAGAASCALGLLEANPPPLPLPHADWAGTSRAILEGNSFIEI